MSHPHDALFRAIFGQPLHAAAELHAVLPPALADALDLTGLTRVEGSFVDEALRASCSDLLFRAPWRRSSAAAPGAEPLLYLLLEHQSTFDPRMPLRLLGYLTRIWERHARDHPGERRLPPIVPIVIHHGTRPWGGPTRFAPQYSLPPPLASTREPELLDFEFLLDDLARCSDADLLARGNDAIARLALLALRTGRDREGFFPRLVAAIRALAANLRGPEAPSALAALASYVCHVGDAPLALVRDTIAAALPPEVRSPFMTIAEQLKAEGRVEGRAEGRTEGALAAQRESLSVVLESRFGPLDAAVRARIAAADGEQLLRWIRRCAVAPSVADALGG
ncbi:MAG: Rpn family recombination-promoting nuclease/putative transposase [Planctomycetes bacterium]|nr:Rpn family recombination-promoting nuclease/putative transposase [Planctomycetota bacterium]